MTPRPIIHNIVAMKGSLLAILAIGIPLLLMLWVTSLKRLDPGRPVPDTNSTHLLRAQTGSRPEPGIESPSTGQRASARGMELSEPVPTSQLPPLAVLTDAIDDWLAATQATSRPVGGQGDSQFSERWRLAVNHLARGSFERAHREFDRLLLGAADDPDVMSGKATALLGLDRYEDALPLMERVIERRPDDATTRFNYAIALTALGRRDPAVQALKDLLTGSPHHSRARFNLALLLQASGRLREALTEWRTLTDKSVGRVGVDAPAHAAHAPAALAAAWFHRGEVALALGVYDDASRSFQEVLHTHSEDARALCNLGIAQAAAGHGEEALDSLAKALDVSPDLVPAINQMAYIQAARLRDEPAASLRREVIELCQRSLAIRAVQPNISALRDHLLGWPSSRPF
ncbi:MAG: hypothetical protein AMXMBFR13_14170 [Phycisphaerae bacterium]